VAVVEDGGESGTSLDRPGWRQVRELADTGAVDVVVACKGDRVARSLRDLLNLIAELEAAGVRLVLADEDLDSSSPAGELTFQLRAAVSQYEVALAKQRTRETMAAAKLWNTSDFVDT
jgi:DNA invertase Pin-like site-specific DNA recombinase